MEALGKHLIQVSLSQDLSYPDAVRRSFLEDALTPQSTIPRPWHFLFVPTNGVLDIYIGNCLAPANVRINDCVVLTACTTVPLVLRFVSERQQELVGPLLVPRRDMPSVLDMIPDIMEGDYAEKIKMFDII